jgi:hypothetical protein
MDLHPGQPVRYAVYLVCGRWCGPIAIARRCVVVVTRYAVAIRGLGNCFDICPAIQVPTPGGSGDDSMGGAGYAAVTILPVGAGMRRYCDASRFTRCGVLVVRA